MFMLCFIHDIFQRPKTVLGNTVLVCVVNSFLWVVGEERNLRFRSFQCILIMTD